MKERIRELSKESGITLVAGIDSWGNVVDPHIGLQKLAELIVKECAKIADDNFNKGFCPVGDYIKQHFGVD
jgi:hypothetical protein